ncbi:MAG: SDR family NAD(P)-dependent oxidoreductase [Desulfobacteraceae bacterium]|jgi:short-subunit dehydrogenase
MGKEKEIAVVTGASSGTGRETAKRLAEKGFEVIVAARRMDRLNELAAQFEGITPKQVDLSDHEAVGKFCEYLAGLPEAVSVLVNNAGYSIRGAIEDVPPEAVRRLFEVNVFALIRVTQACLPGMRRQRKGMIVNISSMAGKFPFPMSGVYAATKHAVEAISDALRIEVRPLGIRVVTIRPGFIATEFNEAANRLTGDLLARTDPDYKPLYQASGAAIGKMFVNATVPGPELIAKIILEAVLSDDAKIAYSAGFMSEEFLERRFGLDDEGFDRFLSEKTGLANLKV